MKERIYGSFRICFPGDKPGDKKPVFRLKSIESVEHKMVPRGKALARRHLICASCSSWIQFDSSGCTNSWAEMTGGACVFTCMGCTEVTRLVGEVGDIRQMMESMKRMITRQGLEEERGVTLIQVARLEDTEEKEKCERVMTPGNSSTEESRKGKETAERSSSEDRGTLNRD